MIVVADLSVDTGPELSTFKCDVVRDEVDATATEAVASEPAFVGPLVDVSVLAMVIVEAATVLE